VLTNIPPPDYHQIPNYIYVWLLSRLMSGSRTKSAVTGFFSVLSHIRTEFRNFKNGE
jgi:hypothetical protein